MYVYDRIIMIRSGIYICLLLLLCTVVSGQEIRIFHKVKSDKVKTIRLDKPVLVRTFDGLKIKGMASVPDSGKLILEGKEIDIEDIMMISGYVIRNSREKAVGLGLTIGAGLVLVPALYYILGGIAWGIPNGIFVGATVLVFDLFLAYASTNLMGIYPRRFSTMNWNIVTSPDTVSIPSQPPLPLPYYD